MLDMAIERLARRARWDDEEHGTAAAAARNAFRPLTREEAQALRDREPPVSPWRVVGVQALVGGGGALAAVLLTGSFDIGRSLLYGAATAVLPAALMARGMTSRFSQLSPGASAVSFMTWESVKIAVSVAMLVLAPSIVQPLSWPALLVGLVVCVKVYWLALSWRGRVRHE